MKHFGKYTKNNFGFSLVEIMITVGLLSAVTFIGLKQSDMVSGSMFNQSLDRQIDELESTMTSIVMKKEVCEANFKDSIPKSDFTAIQDTPYIVGGTYLDDRVKLTSIATKLIDGNPYLEIGLEKLQEKASSKNITRRIPLLANLTADSAAIEDCFSLASSMDNTIKYEVAKRICENTYGVGTVKFNQMFDGSDPLNPTCSFDGFVDGFSLTCADGESITRINYNSSTMTLEPVCSRPFVEKDCPNNWIQKVDVNGNFTCASLANYVDDTAVAFTAGDICSLKVDTSVSPKKVKFSCLVGAPCVDDINTCADPATVTCNQPNNNSCGNPCSNGPIGTMCSASPVCDDPATVACGEPVLDTSGNSCGSTGTGLNTSQCADPSTVPSGQQINDSCGNSCGVGTMASGPSCTPPSCSAGYYYDICANGPSSPPTNGSIYACQLDNSSLHYWCVESNPSGMQMNPSACLSASGPPSGGTSGGGGGCFVAGTEISMFDGSKKYIEDITIDDILMGTDNKEVRIKKLIKFEHDGFKYSFNGSGYFVTGGHPFKTLKGWKAFDLEAAKKDNPNLAVQKLEVGDIIYTEKGLELVREVDRIKASETVYNFHVDGINEYIANGYQVHNKLEAP